MDSSGDYELLYRKIKAIYEDLNRADIDLKSFARKIDTAFLVNNNPKDRNKSSNISEDLNNKKETIRNDILPEIRRNI